MVLSSSAPTSPTVASLQFRSMHRQPQMVDSNQTKTRSSSHPDSSSDSDVLTSLPKMSSICTMDVIPAPASAGPSAITPLLASPSSGSEVRFWDDFPCDAGCLTFFLHGFSESSFADVFQRRGDAMIQVVVLLFLFLLPLHYFLRCCTLHHALIL